MISVFMYHCTEHKHCLKQQIFGVDRSTLLSAFFCLNINNSLTNKKHILVFNQNDYRLNISTPSISCI